MAILKRPVSDASEGVQTHRAVTEGTRFHTVPTEAALPEWIETWDIPISGSSGLFALRLALHMGFARVLLCGIPLDGSGHFYDPPGAAGYFTDQRPYWEPFRNHPSVRATSGYTRELFGPPEKGFI